MKRSLGHFGDKSRYYGSLKRDTRWVPAVLLLLLALLLLGAVLVLGVLRPASVAGVRLIPQGSMSSQEMQHALDEEVERSRITVSLRPAPPLDEATGALGINFVVVPSNNGYGERFEIQQNGATVFKSAVVDPGRKLEQVTAPGLTKGDATVTVYAVDGDGRDHGNPVSVEVSVV